MRAALSGAANRSPLLETHYMLHARETWVFDLDNTLYPAESRLFDRIDVRMERFIAELFDLPGPEARKLQKDYFFAYGTTLKGLMERHGVAPKSFLDYVHDIDISDIARNAELNALLAALPGRKLVYTNGSERHAERLLDQIGIAAHFDGVFDIAAGDYEPKPQPLSYERFVERFDVNPQNAVMVEDMARNLAPAHEMGMATIWIDTGSDWGAKGADQHYVHHRTRSLEAFLADVVDQGVKGSPDE
ncbi:MAG: pyrimidine 5'-nucleotidase [Pseudomonadota bacterium]